MITPLTEEDAIKMTKIAGEVLQILINKTINTGGLTPYSCLDIIIEMLAKSAYSLVKPESRNDFLELLSVEMMNFFKQLDE